jgi:hypothetical protein
MDLIILLINKVFKENSLKKENRFYRKDKLNCLCESVLKKYVYLLRIIFIINKFILKQKPRY